MDFLTVIRESTPYLLKGLVTTVGVSLISIVIGFFIGLIACLFGISNNKFLRGINSVYVWIIRGTPMIVQASFIFFGVPQLISQLIEGFKFDLTLASVLTLSLNAGAYMSEIFRSGIQAVSKGQQEAARSLGLTKTQTMIRIVLPQAFKITIPSLVNQFIITIKDSSILSVIGLGELVNSSKVYIGRSYQYFSTYAYLAVYYLVIISILMVIAKYVERWVSNGSESNR